MVFVMVTDVKGYCVEHAIITKRFLQLVVGEVVFLYPACAKGMETDGEEEAEQEIGDRFRAKEIPDGGDENGFSGPVERYPFVKRLYLPEAGNAEYLENGVEKQPDDLADKEVIDEFGFPAIGEIGVELVNALEGMVFYVVTLEGDRTGEELGKVGQDPAEPVSGPALEEQVVRAFMDHDKEGMIGKSTQQVGCADNEPPGAIFYDPGEGHLEKHESKDGKERILVLSDKLSYFRVLLQNLFGPEPVGLLLNGINKISSL